MGKPHVRGGSFLLMGMLHGGQPQLLHERPLQWGWLLSFHWVTMWSPRPRIPKRGVKMPQAALLSFSISSIHMSMWGSPSTDQDRAQGNLPPKTTPLRQWPAGTWANNCTNRHCPAFWWGHPGSPSPSPPPTLAVLNTNALCHLVILGKKDCSWR